jgi:8-oxo-dGTP pyrophosphatase MutT (NUDIX family)
MEKTTNVKYRYSYGIALTRNNPRKENRLEILLMKRRMTYHFYSFVMGHYHMQESDQFLKYLFDNMTVSEKLDIMNMNFDNIWYRAWLYNPEKDYHLYSKSYVRQMHLFPKWIDSSMLFSYKNYRKKKSKFDLVFGKNPQRLKNLLHQSQNIESLWDIPKGRREDGESNLETAIREFNEETMIQPNAYTILSPIPITHSYKDQDVVYVNTFFIATINDLNWTPRLDFTNTSQLCETEYLKWIGMAEIDFLNMNRKMTKQLQLTFQKIKSFIKLEKKRFKKPDH